MRGRSAGDGTRRLTIDGPAEVIAAIEDDVRRLAEALVADRLAEESRQTDDRGGRLLRDDGTGREVEGSVDDLPVDAKVERWVTAADQVDALAAALAVAAAAETPPDTTGLDRDTLVLHGHVDDLAAAVEGVPDGPAPAGRRGADVVPVADDHRRVRGMDRRALRRLACDAGIVLVATDRDGSPLDVGRRTRRTTAALRRALQRRDRGCTFPGCAATRNLHAHHVEHWVDGGATALSNMVLLCGFHHRFVHAAGWHIEVRPDGRHRVRAAGDRDPMPRVGALPSASAGAVAAAAPASASAASLLPATYDGSPYDLDVAVAILQRYHEAAHGDLELAA